ncbi:allophanate hydrolase [Micromonospora pallida]|uniref:Allophanate hydrolase n=1 Tax=Micromonospora pallida TaxID=145854 RepID=A0A1C6T5E9_9ACTN|nr:allophanate hydrolase [Micromonospora pallida]SCL37024.1 allophanate hydrolase [Micromonospora pallida]
MPPSNATAGVERALKRLAQVDRPEVWTSLRTADSLLAEAQELDARAADGEALPLLGLTVAVKDNIDVAGQPTTLGCPGAAWQPDVDADAVARLRRAGAIVLGKTNLDQFATGLVGTRSPYGVVRNAHRPELVSGGSSSGSAVAVALEVTDLALGTDTAGSGRVPAALNGIVGVKPTLGLVPTTGMADACRPFDTITVFGRDLDTAVRGVRVITGPGDRDGLSRRWPTDVRLAAGPRPTVAVPDEAGLRAVAPELRPLWDQALARLATVADLRVVDVSPLLDAALLLYEGAIVAGRYAAAGRWVGPTAEDGVPGLDPTVAGIVRGARTPAGWEYVRDRAALDDARARAAELLAGCTALVLPTAPLHPTIAEVAADPVGVNSRMGTYTNFVNLLDLCATAVPAGENEAGSFGISVIGRAFDDQVCTDIAARFLGVAAPSWVDTEVPLAVVGAHLRGGPLHHELVDLGARFGGDVTTAPSYRLYALDTEPPKPGLVEVASGGAEIAGELWWLSPGGLGRFLAALPAPMTLGRVRLADGRDVVGFGCTPGALTGAEDITAFGGWRAYQQRAGSPA